MPKIITSSRGSESDPRQGKPYDRKKPPLQSESGIITDEDVATITRYASRLTMKLPTSLGGISKTWTFNRDESGSVPYKVAFSEVEMDDDKYQVLWINANDNRAPYHEQILHRVIDSNGATHDVRSIDDYCKLKDKTMGPGGFSLITQSLKNYMFTKFMVKYLAVQNAV